MSRHRLSLLAFTMAHSGKMLLWSGADGLSLYILIKIVAVSPIAAGTLFALSSFWNALLDGAWGHWVDRSLRLRVALPAVSALASLTACLSFAILPGLPSGSVAAAAVALFLFRTSFALIDVPHNALIGPLAEQHGHLALSRWRSMLSAAMSILIALAAMVMLNGAAGGGRIASVLLAALALAAYLLLLPLPWLIRTHRIDPSAPSTDLHMASIPLPARPLLFFCITQMAGFAALASIGKSILHLEPLSPWLLAHAMLLLSVVRLFGTAFWAPVAKRLGSAAALCLAYLACALVILLLPLAFTLGLHWSVFALCLLGGCFGGIALLVWSSYSELLARIGTGPDAMASSYGLFTALSKIGLGLSGLLTAVWISGQGDHLTVPSLWPSALLIAALCAMVSIIGRPGFAVWLFDLRSRRWESPA